MATLLLVDDERIIRTLLGVALKRQGYTVLEAGGGRRALTVAEKQGSPIDLLVSELSLPRMNALKLVAELGAVHPELKVLLLSRSPHPERLEAKALEAGHRVLREPFDVMTLLGEVAHLLDPPGGTRKPPAIADGKQNAITRTKKARRHS